MNHYKGMFDDRFLECDAKDEQEAQEIMKQLLLAEITADPEPFIVWEDSKNESNTDQLI